MTVVTRFAPSPTGHLHIGGCRTAIFNWFLARHFGGTFLLRIEDTDRARSEQAMTDDILNSLTWLGLEWDGEPIYQSRRFDLYNTAVDWLLNTDHAYWCACTPNEIQDMRNKAMSEGHKPKYNGHCRERGLGPGPDRVVRFKSLLTGKTVFKDMVKGILTVNNAELDDMILRRTDGTPVYNLAVVIDDHDLGTTHIIRGNDHVNNTPRQILLYQALGFPIPRFGHVSLIFGQDKKKLSKRHGARSVMEYRADGLLPEAIINYLVRLGWSAENQEIFSREEIITKFDGTNLSVSPAAFNPDKLLWLNKHYLKTAAPARLGPLLAEHLSARGRDGLDLAYLETIIPLYQPRVRTLVEMTDAIDFLITSDNDLHYDNKAVAKFLTSEARSHLAAIKNLFATLPELNKVEIEQIIQSYLDAQGITFKFIAQPLRIALTGQTTSPSLFEIMAILGRERSLRRIQRAITID
ncbi:Glutamate--tRNA ligase [Desulfovibrionales bacterium]